MPIHFFIFLFFLLFLTISDFLLVKMPIFLNTIDMSNIEQFKKILKGKGTGKTMSKHMALDDISFVLSHFNSPDIPMAMKATLLTAWLMLDATDEEAVALNQLKNNINDILPNDLHFLFNKGSSLLIDQQVSMLLNHQSLSRKDLMECLSTFHSGDVPDYKIAALLEGLRLKEETFEENSAVYDFFKSKAKSVNLNIPLIIDMATPYDGFNRHYFLQPFLAALLASIGIPSILHGVQTVSPKNGMNTHKLFLNAGKHPLKSLDNVAKDILDPTIGWGYIDQSIFCPPLHDLIPTRIAMVKRPVLATIEKWLQPISANRTVCLTGFTHPPYKQKTIDMVHHAGIYDDLMLIRGVEGSTLLPYDRRAPFIISHNNQEPTFDFISPTDVSHEPCDLGEQNPDETLIKGIDALTGNNQQLSDYLCYQALAIGTVIGHDINKMTNDLMASIDSGKALSHWENIS
ncbi:hypothetical protein DID73_02155 [Candidatus Marinamargulisbacteria bacterium SCGC AG-343-K17]|nr:hypothetical protein DID73_02155 [Candidatus Marinamargulisbacteria bacterium SCGC AG-343-K17]